MIEQNILNFLQEQGNVYYSRYSGPVGDIYMLGNETTLNALIYNKSYPGKTPVSTHFKKGAPESIKNMIVFLDNYFSDPGQTIKSHIKNRSLLVSCGKAAIGLDLSQFSDKEIAVYRELIKVPAGETVSYGELAFRARIPRGARFVGNAMAKNNFPIIIPCHRVIKSDGSMGNYSGGVHIKKYLLDHEKAV